MSRSRIAVVVKYFPPYPRISGVLTYLALLAAEMGETHDVHVVTSSLPEDAPAQESVQTCTVHRVGWPFPLTSAREVRRIRPEVTLTVSGIYDLRQAIAYFLPGLVANPRRSTHHLYQATWPARPPGAAFRWFARRHAGLLCGSEGMREMFVASGLDAATVAPAVDVAGLRAAAHADGSGVRRVGFVNHLNSVKGADVASEVIARLAASHPALDFVIAGVGELAEAMRERHGDDDRITFVGFLPEQRRVEVLASCDVMVLPFRQAASVLGVSQTALEVMALGNVVVGTATASLEGAIIDGRNGILVDPDGDVATATVDAIEGLIRDEQLRGDLGRTAASDAADSWDIARRAREVPSLLGLPDP